MQARLGQLLGELIEHTRVLEHTLAEAFRFGHDSSGVSPN
eukprot:gene7509-7023_t